MEPKNLKELFESGYARNPALTDLAFFANPGTGVGGVNTISAILSLITSSTTPKPVTLFDDITALLANTDIETKTFAFVVDASSEIGTGWALYLYVGGDRDQITSYQIITYQDVIVESWPLTGLAALTGDVSMSYGLDKRVKFGVAGFANVLFQIGQQDSSTEDVLRIVDIDGTTLMAVGSDGDVLRFHISPASGRTGFRVDPAGVHALSQVGAESGRKTTLTMYDHNETGGSATADFDLFGSHEDAGMTLKISAVGVRNDGSEIYTREKTVIILKDGSANPTIKATLIDTEFDEDDATADADVSMNGSDVRLTVVTPTGKTYRWTVFAEYTFNPRT